MNRGQIFIFEEGRRLKGGVEEYVNGAELQIRRIDRTRKTIRKTFQSQQDFERIDSRVVGKKKIGRKNS